MDDSIRVGSPDVFPDNPDEFHRIHAHASETMLDFVKPRHDAVLKLHRHYHQVGRHMMLVTHSLTLIRHARCHSSLTWDDDSPHTWH
jgi:hypothetical protein